MSGTFEIFHDEGMSFGFRVKAPNGTVVALSGRFPDKASAVEGIRVVRECAGMGLITDLCPMIPPEAEQQIRVAETASTLNLPAEALEALIYLSQQLSGTPVPIQRATDGLNQEEAEKILGSFLQRAHQVT